MSNDIRIKKGLDIKLKGEAEKTISNAIVSKYYALRPEDFHNVIPKLSVKVGSKVKAGEPVFYNKNQENVKFASPVSGEVIEIARGEKRRILEIKIQADATQTFQDNGKLDVGTAKAEDIKEHLLVSGCWPFVKQRPYDVIANPDKTPKAIFISGYASAPLAANLDFTLQGKEAELQAAITALGKLTEGKVHVTTNGAYPTNKVFSNTKGVELNSIDTSVSGKIYILSQDIDMQTILDFDGIGTVANPLSGVFDGNGHTIYNVNYTSYSSDQATRDYIGLFGYSNAFLYDITLTNMDFYVLTNNTHELNVGVLAGHSGGTIIDCNTWGTNVIEIDGMTEGYVGGLVGSSGRYIRDSIANTTIIIDGLNNESIDKWASKMIAPKE